MSDLTYLRTSKGWVYLTVVLDLFDRKVIGWGIERQYGERPYDHPRGGYGVQEPTGARGPAVSF